MNSLINIIEFDPQHPIVYLSSFLVEGTLMQIVIPLSLGHEVQLQDVATNARAVIEAYLNSIPNVASLTYHSNFQGVIQTYSGIRGIQPYIWIKTICSVPHGGVSCKLMISSFY